MELMEDIILKTLINKCSKLSSHDILGNYSKYVIIHSCDMHVYTKLHDMHQIFFYLTYTLWLMYHINWNMSDNVICGSRLSLTIHSELQMKGSLTRELNTLRLSKACVFTAVHHWVVQMHGKDFMYYVLMYVIFIRVISHCWFEIRFLYKPNIIDYHYSCTMHMIRTIQEFEKPFH